MITSNNDNGVSDRLRGLVLKRYGKYKKFVLLEADSKIPASKWKNFFYAKQDATEEMVQFWSANFPDDVQWLSNGFNERIASNNPFKIDFPTLDQRLTLQDRLKWVISEWCAQTGTKIFKFLEEKTLGKIAAIDWLNMVLGRQKPTLEMIEFVCTRRPHFSCWVLLGSCPRQVDPTNEQSVQKWIEQAQ